MKKFLVLMLTVFSVSVFAVSDFVKKQYPVGDDVKAVIEYDAYAVLYDKVSQNPIWVICEVGPEALIANVERKDCFDKDQNGNGADPKSFSGENLDTGHQAPCGYFLISFLRMKESFYMTNMCGQDPNLNRGIWKKLEQQVLEWVRNNYSFVVVCGPVWIGKEHRKTHNGVWVPEAFFKTIWNTKTNEKISFIFPNHKIDKEAKLSDFVVTSLEVKHATGREFFPKAKEVDFKTILNWK